MQTVRRGLEWLIAHPALTRTRAALVGRSKGGEPALLAAASYPDKVSAVVGYVPSPIAWQDVAFDRSSRRRAPRSSWTIAGETFPLAPGAPCQPGHAGRAGSPTQVPPPVLSAASWARSSPSHLCAYRYRRPTAGRPTPVRG